MPKILEISPEPPFSKSGIGQLVCQLTAGLRANGCRVDVLYPTFRFREFKFSRIPLYRYSDYDIVHVHGPTPFLSDLILAAEDSNHVIYTHYAEISWLSETLSKIYRALHRVLAKKARAIIVASDDYARLFRSHHGVHVIRYPCRFKSPNSDPLKNGRFTVLYVGQLRPFKGVDVLIRAARLLPKIKFSIVGDGYLSPTLLKMAQNLSNVSFEGPLTDNELQESYERTHIICLPSVNTTEGYGLVLIEGSLFGAVPIASNLLGVRENVLRLRGITFEPGNHLSLAKVIESLSKDTNVYARYSEISRKAAASYVRTYSLEYYVRTHMELFRECC